MKKRIFDLRLYRDAMKQGKMVGLTTCILLLLEAILIPVGNVIDRMRMAEDAVTNGWNHIETVELVGMLEIHPLLLITFCVATPILMLYLFSWLTKRNACDFYHSIPQTRSCVFFSFFGAAMTWVLLYTLVPALIGSGLCALFAKYYTVNWGNVASILFNVTAANLLVASSIAIAVSLTGTTFTNMIVSVLIIFVPRIFMMVVTLLVTGNLPMVPDGYLMPLLDVKYNVVFGSVASMFVGSSGNLLTEFGSGLYTLILGLVYMIAALWLFNRRRSEAAGQAAASRKLQMVYRLIVSMLVCLIPCALIFNAMAEGSTFNISEVYLLFVVYVIAVVTYFLYELITTRKWRNLVKAIPGLGVLAVMNLVLIGGMWLLYSVTLNTMPEAEDISYVKLVNADSPTYFNGKIYEDYFAAKTSAVELKSEDVKELVSDRLQVEVDKWKHSYHTYHSYFDNMDEVVMEIRIGARTIYRYIFLDQEDWTLLTAELEKQEAFRNAYMELPKLGTHATAVRMDELDTSAASKVYEALLEDIKDLGFGNWYTIAEGSLYRGNRLEVMTLATAIGSKTYASAFPIIPEMTRTAKAYIEAMNAKHTSDKEAILNFLENWENIDYSYMNMHVKPFQKESNQEMSMDWQNDKVVEETFSAGIHYSGYEGRLEYEGEYLSWEELVELVLANKDKEIDPNGVYGWISLDLETKDEKGNWSGNSYRYCFNLEGLSLEK